MLQKPFLIYLADDDLEDRMLFREALDEIDTSISTIDFDNGVTLMDQLLKTDQPLPYAIYLDLNMPLMDGEECIDDIRSEPRFSKIPIVIYSTYADEYVTSKLQKKGANWCLIKPNSYNELKKLLQKSLEYIQDYHNNTSSNMEFIITS